MSLHPQICDWCGSWTRPIFKKSHYECGRCKRSLLDCCDGETAQPETERTENDS
jgi:uncharacterized protein YjlB